ncbi:MAG: hypothetical protein WCL16_12095, partial [bacterium]
MKKRKLFAGAAGIMLLGGAALAADGVVNPVYKAQADRARINLAANKLKVAEALKAASLPGGQAAYFVVPAMSDVMRLPDVYPDDGRLNSELRIVAAQDEFEPASFQLYSFTDRKDVKLVVSALKGPDGATLPAN